MNRPNLWLLMAIILFATIGSAEAQKKKRKKKKEDTSVLKLYEGPELPADQVVRLNCDDLGKQYAYFIGVDDEKIENNSLMNGAKQIALLAGEHKIQVRFVAKGKIAIPIQPFDPLSFDPGQSYQVKFEYTPGENVGGYFADAQGTRIKLWIESDGKKLTEMMVDGFGERLDE